MGRACHAAYLLFAFPRLCFKLDGESIAGSWTAPVPVRWLPLQRQRYEPQNASVGLVPAQRVLTETDYHPFIHLRSVLHAIFEEAGYRLVSAFVDSAYFDSLYMSGNYPTRDATLLRSRMDFLAARFGEAATTADSGGRVYADPLAAYNTVGNIVDTADPDEERDGVSLKRVFTRGGCFGATESGWFSFPLTALRSGSNTGCAMSPATVWRAVTVWPVSTGFISEAGSCIGSG